MPATKNIYAVEPQSREHLKNKIFSPYTGNVPRVRYFEMTRQDDNLTQEDYSKQNIFNSCDDFIVDIQSSRVYWVFSLFIFDIFLRF